MTLTKEDIIKNIEFKSCLNERTMSDILNFIINELNNNDTDENTKLFLEKLTLHVDLIQILLTRISVASILICLAVFLKTNRTSLNCTILVCACLAVIFAQAALFSEALKNIDKSLTKTEVDNFPVTLFILKTSWIARADDGCNNFYRRNESWSARFKRLNEDKPHIRLLYVVAVLKASFKVLNKDLELRSEDQLIHQRLCLG